MRVAAWVVFVLVGYAMVVSLLYLQSCQSKNTMSEKIDDQNSPITTFESSRDCERKVMKWAKGERCGFLSVQEFEKAFPCGVRTNLDRESPIKIIVSVMASNAVIDRAKHVHRSWGQVFANKSAIFYSLNTISDVLPIERQLVFRDSNLTSDDSSGSANWRSLYALIHAARQFPDADWIFMTDDDTYVNPWNLRLLIERIDPEIPILIGFIHDFPAWNKYQCFVAGGAGMLISKAAASKVSKKPKDLLSKWVKVSDVTLSIWARKNDVLMLHSSRMFPEPGFPGQAHTTADFGDLITLHHLSIWQISSFYEATKKKWQSIGFDESYVSNLFAKVKHQPPTNVSVPSLEEDNIINTSHHNNFELN